MPSLTGSELPGSCFGALDIRMALPMHPAAGRGVNIDDVHEFNGDLEGDVKEGQAYPRTCSATETLLHKIEGCR